MGVCVSEVRLRDGFASVLGMFPNRGGTRTLFDSVCELQALGVVGVGCGAEFAGSGRCQ